MDWMKVFRTAEISGATSSVWLWLILVFAIFIKSSSADQQIITAESGKDITLPCQAPNNNIRIVEWSRADQEIDYVLIYRDKQFVPDDQHSSFKNRVDLQDRQMKDGDVSLILKNVTTADNGTYKCHVLMGETHSLELITSIYLHVVLPGQQGGHTEDGGKEAGWEKDVVVIAVIIALHLFILFAAVWCHRKMKTL